MSDRPGASRTLLRGASLAILFLTAACAAPPQKEMDQAQGAIDTARAAGAAQYAAAEFAAAETALRRSNEAVTQRDFRQALNQALDARERAQTAAREAADMKAVARGQAESALTGLELALASGHQRLTTNRPATPPGRRATPAPLPALAALATLVSAGDATLQEARSHVQAQRFDAALALARPMSIKVRTAITALDDARTVLPAPRATRRGR
ncbi:MAG: hypothetical protein H0V80_10430 [Acidobacteria bacterium]|nr:hypothetical protein [Acidobacteriota bacterium]